jgi:hypothetical protein
MHDVIQGGFVSLCCYIFISIFIVRYDNLVSSEYKVPYFLSVTAGLNVTRCVDLAEDCEDSSSTNSAEQQEQLTRQAEERKVYVRRVSSRVYHRVRSTATTPSAFPHLFQCVLLVGLNLDSDKKTKVPYIKTKYPLDVSECVYLVEVLGKHLN